MIVCRYCGKQHKEAKKVAECKAKAERAEARAAKKQADVDRREANLVKKPIPAYVKSLLHAGKHLDNVVAGLKKDYPLRPDLGPYTLWDVALIRADQLNWPGISDRTTKALMLVEKHYLGAYVTLHPLEAAGVAVLGSESIGSLQLRYDATAGEGTSFGLD